MDEGNMMTNQQNPQIRILHLKEGENRTDDIFRLQQGQVLRFLLDHSLLTKNKRVRLFTNYPLPHVRGKEKRGRDIYSEVHWQCSSSTCSVFTDVVAEITVDSPGTYHFYYNMDVSWQRVVSTGNGHFIVDPKIRMGNGMLPLDSLCMQTVVTKLLGQFEHWESRLKVAIEAGYNVIHFTPVQELGCSNSAYCIKDHHRLSSAYSFDKRRIYLMMPHLKDLVDKLFHEHQVLSVTDLVLNHMAMDAPFLECHPEGAYNLKNSPHLRPAYLVDRILYHFTLEVSHDLWCSRGVPAHLTHRDQLDVMRHILHCEVFPKYKIPEFYQCDVEEVVKQCRSIVEEKRDVLSHTVKSSHRSDLPLKQDPEYRRNKCILDYSEAVTTFFLNGSQNPGDCPEVGEQDHLDRGCKKLRKHLLRLNQEKENEIWGHLQAAIDNFIKNAEYRFLAENGPRLQIVSKENPIQPFYFVCPYTHNESVEKAEIMMKKDPHRVMVVNGWLHSDEIFRNFTEDLTDSQSYIYLRRELSPWGDNIKLHYGEKPLDCQPLWDYMQIYTETSAKIFHGVRLDHTHSTPLHVSEHMLDAARRIRPQLYVMAELHTGNDRLDHYFVNHLGINAIIREMKNADNTGSLMSMVASYGGAQLGSFLQPRVQDIIPVGAPAIFYDQIHDNDTPINAAFLRRNHISDQWLKDQAPSRTVLRSEFNLWPSSAVLAMTKCATGSTRGYDELVPYQIDVVKETRLYQHWATKDKDGVDISMGLIRGKRLLNKLHQHMAEKGFTDIYMEDLGDNVLQIVRYNPTSHQSVIMVAAMMYGHSADPRHQLHPRPIFVEGVVEEVLFEGCLVHDPGKVYEASEDEINGLPITHFYLELRENIHVGRSNYCMKTSCDPESKKVTVTFSNLIPGTVVVLQCNISKNAEEASEAIEKSLAQYNGMMQTYTGLPKYNMAWKDSGFKGIASHLTLGDLNRVMYRVSVEEAKDGYSISTYNVPNYGALSYCGLRGVMSVLAEVRTTNAMGHPLCNNLRAGPWLMDYIVHRLDITASTRPLAKWLEELFGHVKNLPTFLKPFYFDTIVTGTYVVLREMALQQFTEFVKEGSTFVQALALCSVQFLGYVRNAQLPPLSTNLIPGPRTEVFYKAADMDQVWAEEQAPVSLASGLPHFAEGRWRCWGRDTFISLRGMLLITGRYADARSLILAFGGALRHGLIPNLLWEGQDARYNCRDALWWWLQAIQDYVLNAVNGESILQDPVLRLYPTDDTPPNRTGYIEQPLHAVIQEALSRHMAGIQFRERGAGPDLDPYMSDEGFNVQVGVRWPEGYVYGGSVHNCGTWMDFMGRSHAAGNWGKPATPRDGSAVEIVGLSYSVLTWLAQMSQRGAYPYRGVTRSMPDFKEELVTFEQWAANIKKHFEADFYISPNFRPKPCIKVPYRCGIYKDCLHATQVWAEYQFRPNFCVAMVLAPDLFDKDHAWGALELAEQVLMGPVGMKTLDPSDPNYNGYYTVRGDYNDPKVAAGYNYHNGPEFLWPMAYFLRAKLQFASLLEKRQPGVLSQTVSLVKHVLHRQSALLNESTWKSLPQLTNQGGEFCEDSCHAQATSNACVLEVLYSLECMADIAPGGLP